MSYTPAEREAAAALLDLSKFESAAGVSHADVTATASDLGADEATALTVLDALSEIKESGGKKKKRGGSKTSEAAKQMSATLLLTATNVGNAADEAAAKLISSLPSIVGVGATGFVTNMVMSHPTVLANMVSLVRQGVSAAAEAGTRVSWSDWGSAGLQVADELKKLGGDMAGLSVAGPYVPYIIASLAYRYRASKSGKSVVALIKDDIEVVKSKGGNLVESAAQYTFSQISAFKLASAAETGRLQRKNVSGLTSGLVPAKRPSTELYPDEEEPSSKRAKVGGKRRRKTVRKSKGKKRVTRRALFAY